MADKDHCPEPSRKDGRLNDRDFFIWSRRVELYSDPIFGDALRAAYKRRREMKEIIANAPDLMKRAEAKGLVAYPKDGKPQPLCKFTSQNTH